MDFHVLRNRQLTATIFLFITLGFGLYGGIFIYPLVTQTLLHFTPTETGLALLPGGIATGVTAIVCGRLLNGRKPLVDPRVLIYIGVAIFAYSMWDLGHMTLASGIEDTKVALIFRGMGLGFLFAPINQVAYGSLDPKDAQQASGLINLARQLGGSFGIAVIGTFLAQHSAFHRANLVQNLVPGSPAFDQRISMMQQGFMSKGFDAYSAHQAALKAIDGAVNQQALSLTYNDAFLMILVVFVCTAPAILILKKPKAMSAPAEAH